MSGEMWELIGSNDLLNSILMPAESHLVTDASGAKSQGLTDPLGLVIRPELLWKIFSTYQSGNGANTSCKAHEGCPEGTCR